MKGLHKNKLNQIQTQTIWCVTLLLLHTHFSICKRVSGTPMDSLESPELDTMLTRSGCAAGTGMKCQEVEDPEEETEMQMESEISRRVLLMRRSYISYETLRRDMTPCERPGASYYNCRSTGVANPYTRGCEMIVGCARAIRDINY